MYFLHTVLQDSTIISTPQNSKQIVAKLVCNFHYKTNTAGVIHVIIIYLTHTQTRERLISAMVK